MGTDDPSGEKTYRLRRYYMKLGVGLGLLLFLVAIAMTILATLNPDGSFPGPDDDQTIIIVMGTFLSCMGWLGVFLIAYWSQYRLQITSDTITEQGILRSKEIKIADIRQIVWRCYPEGGSILVKSEATKISVGMDYFIPGERKELIDYFREGFPESQQEKWQPFHDRIVNPPPAQPVSRAFLLVIILVLFSFSVFFFWCWFNGAGRQHLGTSILNIVVLLYFVYRLWRRPKLKPSKAETLE